ncbi:hypothetical protein QR685DRAFT_439066 [Neurospora intermedia]|uniref:Uncharacterized protein n=1 Tax=Neurospora intermedia TaxID=5142 RepID=A0ABR3DFU2_NEUIN
MALEKKKKQMELPGPPRRWTCLSVYGHKNAASPVDNESLAQRRPGTGGVSSRPEPQVHLMKSGCPGCLGARLSALDISRSLYHWGKIAP